jgi:hypothetical protein
MMTDIATARTLTSLNENAYMFAIQDGELVKILVSNLKKQL